MFRVSFNKITLIQNYYICNLKERKYLYFLYLYHSTKRNIIRFRRFWFDFRGFLDHSQGKKFRCGRHCLLCTITVLTSTLRNMYVKCSIVKCTVLALLLLQFSVTERNCGDRWLVIIVKCTLYVSTNHIVARVYKFNGRQTTVLYPILHS